MKWIFTYLRPLGSRISVGITIKIIGTVAELIIDSSLKRKESRGLHYNADYPFLDPELECVDTIIQRDVRSM